MKKTLISLAIVSLLSGCAIIQSTGLNETDPTVTTQMKGVKKEFDAIQPPQAGKPLSVAVYSFADKTGQRRPTPGIASLSTAVTQGAETFLIQALQNVGQGRWFEVVERVGVDNLTKERLIIRQMREAYEGANAKPLMPLQFAGMIIEGGIIGYDTTTTSGGAGVRIFGIGKQTQWSTDTVTISLRAISVNTGKVLMSVTVQKTILSTSDSVTVVKFFDQATQAFEAEGGMTINEPGTYATKAAVELAVVELIKEGVKKGVWDYKEQEVKLAPSPVVRAEPPISSEIRSQPKPEEKKDVVVPPQTPKEPAPAKEQSTSVPQQSDVGPGIKGNETTSSVIDPIGDRPTEEKIVIPEPKIESKLTPQQMELFSPRLIKEDTYLFKDQDEKGVKKWLFKKGTRVTIRELGSDRWLRVTDTEFKGGWIKEDKLILEEATK